MIIRILKRCGFQWGLMIPSVNDMKFVLREYHKQFGEDFKVLIEDNILTDRMREILWKFFDINALARLNNYQEKITMWSEYEAFEVIKKRWFTLKSDLQVEDWLSIVCELLNAKGCNCMIIYKPIAVDKGLLDSELLPDFKSDWEI